MKLGSLLEDDIVFCTDFVTAVCPVRVDPTCMEVVVMELMLQARGTAGARGTVVIGIDKLFEPKVGGGAAESWVQLEISGSGSVSDGEMDQDTLRTAFHPFLNTHPLVEERELLGLAMVHRMLQHCSGTMRVCSTPRHGSNVHVRIPVVAYVAEA